jgi:hypothetical protein
MSLWSFASLSVGRLRRLQITIVRSVILSSACYHLPSEYDTRSGERSDVRKGAVSLTVYTPFSKHSNDTLMLQLRFTDVLNTPWTGIAQSVQRLATGWTIEGSNPGGGEDFRTRPDRPWCPLSLHCQKYRFFPGSTATRPLSWSPSTSSAEVKERVELYHYNTSGPLWPVLGQILHFFTYQEFFCRNLTTNRSFYLLPSPLK